MKYTIYSFLLSFCICISNAYAMECEDSLGNRVVYNTQKTSIVVYNSEKQKVRKLKKTAPSTALSLYESTYTNQNIFIRPTFPQDWKPLCSIFCHPDSMKYLGSGVVHTPLEVKELVSRNACNVFEQNAWFFWTIFDQTGVVGRAYIFLTPGDSPYPDVGYAITPKAKGKGYATSTLRLIMEIEAGSLSATVHPDNKPSIAVLLKSGFKRNESKRLSPKYGSVRDYYELKRPNEDQ